VETSFLFRRQNIRLIGTISKIKYLIFKIESGKKSATKLLLVQAVFLILLLSLFIAKGKALSSNENSSENPSLFSSAVSVSQQDYKKEDCTGLAEDSLQQNIDEGVVVAVNNSKLVDTVQEEQQIVGQDYATGAASRDEDYQRREAEEYYVQNGDTLSSVAAKFGISMQTILWANNLDVLSVIQPGDKLTIPPEDGVMYTVKLGDTLLSIANKYNSDTEKIVAFNQLDVDKIVESQVLFLPGGEMPAPSTTLASNPSSSSEPSSPESSSSSTSFYPSSSSQPVVHSYSGGGGSHRFPYGYCTWYVSHRRGGVSWGGNASAWLGNARAAGYATGNQPRPGAIIVTRESWWGHVGYVESVSGNTVTISEMNYNGWGRVNYRTLNKNDWVIRGYIY
jgi:surface antigen